MKQSRHPGRRRGRWPATSLSFTAGRRRADGRARAADGVPTAATAAAASPTPVKVEIFEPTIPLPTAPQAELDFGYAKVKADSRQHQGPRQLPVARRRASARGSRPSSSSSACRPQLGRERLPGPGELAVPLRHRPSSSTTPFPGTSMTATVGRGHGRAPPSASPTTATPVTAPATTPATAGDGGGAAPRAARRCRCSDDLDDILGRARPRPDVGGLARASRGPTARTPPDDAGRHRGLPAPGGARGAGRRQRVRRRHPVGRRRLRLVTSTSRAALGDVRLLGGLVTMSGITSTVDLHQRRHDGRGRRGGADYGTMTIAGQTFGIGPEGFERRRAAGPDPGAARRPDGGPGGARHHGRSCRSRRTRPTATRPRAPVEGLIVTIDLKTLQPVLSAAAARARSSTRSRSRPRRRSLKSLLGSIGNLSPKVVLHLGYTTAAVDTVAADRRSRTPSRTTTRPATPSRRRRRRGTAAARPAAAPTSAAAPVPSRRPTPSTRPPTPRRRAHRRRG